MDVIEYHLQNIFSSLYFVSLFCLLTSPDWGGGCMLILLGDIHTCVSSSPMCELVVALQPDRECFCCTE